MHFQYTKQNLTQFKLKVYLPQQPISNTQQQKQPYKYKSGVQNNFRSL